jgi:hypothetical protein
MGMFDYYHPRSQHRCPVCGHPLSRWQGKDGPNWLFVWAEGIPAPIDHDVPDEMRSDQADIELLRLPARFQIYSHDCPEHRPIDAECYAPDGTWMETHVQPYPYRNR